MSTLKVNNLQVGQDGTAANNYTLYQPAVPDGTVRLGYGVSGSVTDILTLKNSRLGIGTNDPQSSLHAHNASGTTLLRTSVNANSTVGFEIVKTGSTTQSWRIADGQTINGSLEFYDVTDSTTRMIIRDGKVGIGTSNPQAQLSVVLNNNGLEFNPGSGQAIVSYNRSTSAYQPVGMQGSTVGLYIGGVGEALHITSGANVGIGTSSPSDKLSIVAAPNSLILGAKDSTRSNHIFQLLADDAAGNGELRLYQNSGSGTHTKTVEIASSGVSYFNGGSVGINTSAPSTNLHVVGDLTLQNASNNGNAWTYYKNSSRTYIVGLRGSSGNALSFYDLTSGTDSERMRIASNGQVLIGNYDTHSAIHGNLEVNGNDGINISNSYRTGNNGVQWRLIPHNGGGSTTNLRLYEGAGGTEVLNITKTGLIGINLTDPGTKLEVSGGQNQTANQFTDLLRVSANANNDSIDAEVQLNFGISPSHTSTANRRSRIQSTTHAGTAAPLAINPAGGNVGIGVDSPSVMLDVKRAAAGTIARFYDTGSNGGMLYSSGPIMGLSRVSNGNISLHGLFFQVGWDKNSSNSFNIDETVFAVGDKGVGVGEDDPQVMLHCSKGLSSTTSYKDAQMIRIAGTNGVDTMAGIGFGYHTTNPAGSAYPSAWIGAKVSSWTQYVKHDLIFATRDVDTNTEPQERFRITEGNELKQYWDSQYWQYGNFTAGRSGQNATNAPRLAGGIAYGFGYQEAFSTSGGGWSHPYPDLVLGYHTGMRFGGHTSYGGCRFYADHPSSNSTVLFSVGNGGTGVSVTNTLSKGGGSFRIAHPHPSKKWTHDLVHSFIEGPQMDLIYRGKIDLVDGSATVNIDTVSNMTDGTFVLLNRDVQCFTSNETGWTAVKGSVSGNILTITAQDNSCTDTISWMVIGERQDDKIKSLDMTDDDGNLIVEPLTREESHI